ncbi:hypothetical protein CC2G_012253 [Coprinopsis cinerea AmutBmut pab1-1]|nr:hypothetical protein CC2G_012253 [Coprinopsis cinerea AmutBmut pab1-1]
MHTWQKGQVDLSSRTDLKGYRSDSLNLLWVRNSSPKTEIEMLAMSPTCSRYRVYSSLPPKSRLQVFIGLARSTVQDERSQKGKVESRFVVGVALQIRRTPRV